MKHHVFMVSEQFDGEFYHLRADLLRAAATDNSWDVPKSVAEYDSVRNPDRWTMRVTSQGNLTGEYSGRLYAVRPEISAETMEAIGTVTKLAAKLARADIGDGESFATYLARVAAILGIKTLAFRGAPIASSTAWGYSANQWDFIPVTEGIARVAAMESTWLERNRKRA